MIRVRNNCHIVFSPFTNQRLLKVAIVTVLGTATGPPTLGEEQEEQGTATSRLLSDLLRAKAAASCARSAPPPCHISWLISTELFFCRVGCFRLKSAFFSLQFYNYHHSTHSLCDLLFPFFSSTPHLHDSKWPKMDMYKRINLC